MDRRDEVEFLADDGVEILVDADDVVDFAPQRAPNWVLGLCAGVVGVAVILAIAARGDPKHASAPTEPVVPSVPVQPSAPPTSRLGDPLPAGSAYVSDVAVSGDWFYVLQSDSLTATTPVADDPTAYAAARHISAEGLGLPPGSGGRLVLDDAARRLWIVVSGGPVLEFDAHTLQQLRHTSWAEPVSSAAGLGGHLYLATPSGVVDYAPGQTRPALVPALRGHAGSIAADPRRGRLLVLKYGSPSQVLALLPGGKLSPVRGIVPLAKGNLGVTGDGHIWAGGFGDDGAVLVRLNPHTLKPLPPSAPAPGLGPGVLIEAAGARSIWVRSGGGSDGLLCIDARTGAWQQFWNGVPGAVTSQRGFAYVASGGIIRPLVLAGCRG